MSRVDRAEVAVIETDICRLLDGRQGVTDFYEAIRLLDPGDLAGYKKTLAEMPDVTDEERSEIRELLAEALKRGRAVLHEERLLEAQQRADAAKVIEAANVCMEEWAAYEVACEQWAEEWTDTLFAPVELWRVRYLPFWISKATVGVESIEEVIQTVVCMDAPDDICGGDGMPATVTEVRHDGSVVDGFVIGNFLDGTPEALPQGDVTRVSLPFFRSYKAGGFVVNVPPDDPREPGPKPVAPKSWGDFINGDALTVPVIGFADGYTLEEIGAMSVDDYVNGEW